MKKKLIICCITLLCAGGFFLLGWPFFPNGMTINNIDVSHMSAKAAEAKVAKSVTNRKFTVKTDGMVTDLIEGFKPNKNLDKEIKSALHPGAKTSFLRLFNKDRRHVRKKIIAKLPQKQIDEEFNNLRIMTMHKTTKKSENARVEIYDTDYKIVKEIQGDELDMPLLKKSFTKAINGGDDVFDLRMSKYYIKPELTTKSKSIAKQIRYCKKYLDLKITYRTPGEEYTIPVFYLNNILAGSDKKTKIDKSALSGFVNNVLLPKCNTTGMTRTLKSQYDGRKYTVSGGDYGVTLDAENEEKQLIKDFKKAKNVSRRPVYDIPTSDSDDDTETSDSVKQDSNSDIGDTYIEIDLAHQKLWYVANNKKVITSDIISGNPSSGHGTPEGVYSLDYKEKDATLENDYQYIPSRVIKEKIVDDEKDDDQDRAESDDQTDSDTKTENDGIDDDKNADEKDKDENKNDQDDDSDESVKDSAKDNKDKKDDKKDDKDKKTDHKSESKKKTIKIYSKPYYRKPKAKYRMVFNSRIGINDASWKSSFGGKIYEKEGSTGNVFVPEYEAGLLYDVTEPGIPVIVHS